MDKKDINNANQWPSMYYCRHMQAGVARYSLPDGKEEHIFVDEPTMKKMIPSFVGKPVYVFHQEVDLSNLKKTAAGYITESFYNELDGWLWCKYIVIDDEAHEAIAKGWSVSNSYLPIQWNEKGTHLSVDFDREITEAVFQHMAIVPDPRYEKAKNFTPDEFKQYQEEKKQQLNELQNSKGEKKMLNIFRKTKVENPTDLKEGDSIILEDGREVTVTLNNSKDSTESKENAKSKKNGDGESFDLKSLINDAVHSYMSKANMKNDAAVGEETEATEAKQAAKKNKKAKKNDDDMEDDCNNDDDSDEKDEKKDSKKSSKKNDDDMENSKDDETKDNSSDDKESHFDALKNAHLQNSADRVNVIESPNLKLARGSERYGKKN